MPSPPRACTIVARNVTGSPFHEFYWLTTRSIPQRPQPTFRTGNEADQVGDRFPEEDA